MSDNDAKQFIEKLKKDANLREGLASAVRNGAASGASQYGSQQGLSFTGSELAKAYADEIRSRGLSSEDIEDLAHTRVRSAYAATPDASYADHPAYAAGADNSAKYAEPSAASYAEPAAAHYSDSPTDDK